MSDPTLYRRWTVKEHNLLVSLYQTATVPMIARVIDRSEANIKRYIYRIGLRKHGRKPVCRAKPTPAKRKRKKARPSHNNLSILL